MLVTLVGFDILRGRQLLIETNASDFEHLIVACLFHDIGYVRGVLNGEGAPTAILLTPKVTEAESCRAARQYSALMPYRVDRSKLFVMDRVAKIKSLDAVRIANAIECTRHGADDSDGEERHAGTRREFHRPARRSALSAQSQCALLRIRGSRRNKQFGYVSPADLTDLYPKFYWSSVSAHIQNAMRYLNVTSNGRQWIANLHSNIFRAERELSHSGPQR